MGRLQETHIKYLEKHLNNLENGTITLSVHNGIVSRIETQSHSLFDEGEKTSDKKEVVV